MRFRWTTEYRLVRLVGSFPAIWKGQVAAALECGEGVVFGQAPFVESDILPAAFTRNGSRKMESIHPVPFGPLLALPAGFTEDFQLRCGLLRVAATEILMLVFGFEQWLRQFSLARNHFE
jgi:hypothetical protein